MRRRPRAPSKAFLEPGDIVTERVEFFLDLSFLSDEVLEALERVPTEFWALPRPLTSGWGSGAVFERLTRRLGERPDVAFGVRDNIPEDVLWVDRRFGFEWADMPYFRDDVFSLGFWDPPYVKEDGHTHCLFKREAQEIWRTTRRLAILHTHIYPTSWFRGARRTLMVAITMGPLKQIRCLQLFEKAAGPAIARAPSKTRRPCPRRSPSKDTTTTPRGYTV